MFLVNIKQTLLSCFRMVIPVEYMESIVVTQPIPKKIVVNTYPVPGTEFDLIVPEQRVMAIKALYSIGEYVKSKKAMIGQYTIN